MAIFNSYVKLPEGIFGHPSQKTLVFSGSPSSSGRQAAYPFGHGLSYTTFQIRNLATVQIAQLQG